MTFRTALISTALAALPTIGMAMELSFPSTAHVVAEDRDDYTSYALPISPWEKGEVPSIWAEGAMERQAVRIDDTRLNTMQLLAPLRDQLEAQGFDILFECKTRDCGGFDFRFGTEVLPEPEMHVDLGDFRFLSAQRMGAERPEYVSLMVSRSRDAGYVQLTTIGNPADAVATPVKSTKLNSPDALIAATDFLQELKLTGAAVLGDLEFKTGSSKLTEGRYDTLVTLAEYLDANPDQKVLLVGHTDFEGSLSGNVALSRKRADAVRRALTRDYGVSAKQVDAEGVGYLSPRASNLTEDGRTKNRRVEVILTSTQ
ncbi:MAG: OmpA family protein [Brevirhabdus sp.]